MTIARQLDGRREERERQAAAIGTGLQALFAERGIRATVEARAKHIYSIWRKMRTKNVPFDQVYDVLAVRVVVDDLAACYAALGVIHNRWRHIPSEFDDYIASPKENGYRSIHTALIGPDERNFEVQIRTYDMHAEAELGVCAHWWYKDGAAPGVSAEETYAAKMAWLRAVLDGTLAGDDDALRRELGSRVREERIYVYTPGGHVLDLTTGATVLDFAYRVHTEVGHHCVGARVDGRRVSINTQLATGQRVQVDTDDSQHPQLEWLDPELGFVRTARARNKIHEWFRVRTTAVREASGRATFADALATLAQPEPGDQTLNDLASAFGLAAPAHLFQAIGGGDIGLGEIVARLFPDPPVGGIERLEAATTTIRIEARNRHGLLRDVAVLVSDRQLALVANTGRIDRATGTAMLTIEIEGRGLARAWALIDALYQIDGVLRAWLSAASDRNR
jgi:GTP pyrophosphokinase